MAEYFIKRPMLLCALIGTGICVGGYFYSSFATVAAATLILIFFVGLILRIKPTLVFALFILILISVSVNITRVQMHDVKQYSGCASSGRLIITDKPVSHETFYSVSAVTDGVAGVPDGVKLRLSCETANFKCGDAIEAELTLQEIKGDYKKSSAAEKIYLSARVSNYEVDKDNGDYILKKLNTWREYITKAFFSNMDNDEAATVTAVILGESYFSDEFYGSVKSAGIAHVMVVSGMHLTVIVGFIAKLSERIIYDRRFKALLVFLTTVFMVALCGFNNSILRAGVCYLFYAVSILIKRSNVSENTLGAAVSVLFISSPFLIFNIGFQLSVLSTLGIVSAALPVMKFIEGLKPYRFLVLKSIASSVIITLFALLFTLPVTIYIFGYVSTVSVLVNLLISFAVTLILEIGVLAITLNLIHPLLAKPLFLACEVLTNYVNEVIIYFGGLPIATKDVNQKYTLICVLLVFIIIFILFACKKRLNMIKLRVINEKIINEGGKSLTWQ